MEYTLKEHTQDFGVRIGPEECLVVRTKLSVLVAALKGTINCMHTAAKRNKQLLIRSVIATHVHVVSALVR